MGPLTTDELASLLLRTSRTFALAIPLLDEPLRTEVGVAYLLYRIADTLEDAPKWGRDQRTAALDSFAGWLEDDDRAWVALVAESPPDDDAGCRELLGRADAVRALAMANEAAWRPMRRHVARTTKRMREFVSRQDERGAVVLNDVEDLRGYCYAVAGIVGELLTDFFVLHAPSLSEVEADLVARAAAFGEALQLVNILKDAGSDAVQGRRYLPPTVERAAVVALARADLATAHEYLAALRRGGATPDVVRFCTLPVRLAVATLDALDRGEPKLPRGEVMRIVGELG